MASWSRVPLHRKDFDYFGRQRDLFPDWVHTFDDWQELTLEESRRRFERELERMRIDMHRMDVGSPDVTVSTPFITDPSGRRKFSLRFDCSKFNPEEIHVTTRDNILHIQAEHVEERPGLKTRNEFKKKYELPPEVDPLRITSTLSKDGVLQIEGPAPRAVEAPKERLIPIDRL